MKKVFVFGGSGFIGTNLVEVLLKKNFKVYNFDMLSYASVPEKFKKYKNKNYFFKKINMLDTKGIKKFLSNFKPDYIFNLAAISHVDRSIDRPRDTIKNNIFSTLNLLEAVRLTKNLQNLKKIIHLSTDEVYGDFTKPSKELDFLDPSSPYSSSKASCDLLINSYFKTFKLPTVIIRACNNFGPFQFPEKFIPTIISSFINKKKIPVYGNGEQIREWIFVNDFCNLLIKFIQRGKIGYIYNVGSGQRITNINLIKTIHKIIKSEKNFRDCIKFVKDRPAHDVHYSLNSTKAKKILKAYPINSLIKNLTFTVKWYIENVKWLDYTKKKYKGQRLGIFK